MSSGLVWATYNVGATKPTEYGNYYAWGEASTKENYLWSSYKWGTVDEEGKIDSLKKYNFDNVGIVDSISTLADADDAASVIWGDGWRMPSVTEQQELLDGCSWKWISDFNGSGVAGCLGTSNTNGNTIFLPAGGTRQGTDVYSAGDQGNYWSSSIDEDGSTSANAIFFMSGISLNGSSANIDWLGILRLNGLNIRAVANK